MRPGPALVLAVAALLEWLPATGALRPFLRTVSVDGAVGSSKVSTVAVEGAGAEVREAGDLTKSANATNSTNSTSASLHEGNSTPLNSTSLNSTSLSELQNPQDDSPGLRYEEIIVTIGKSGPNSKCVSNRDVVSCSSDAGDQGKRLNPDYNDTIDSFNISVADGRVCATRLDRPRGWGMNLQLSCLGARATPPPTPVPLQDPELAFVRAGDMVNSSLASLQGASITNASALQAVVVTIGKSGASNKCASGNGAVFCASDAANQGKRLNTDYSDASDAFNVSVASNGKVCVERLDIKRGWGMELQISCLAVPATMAPTPPSLTVGDLPDDALSSLWANNMTLSSLQAVVVTIGKSGPNSKCVSGSGAVYCPIDAGNQGKRLNPDYSDEQDTFNVTVAADGKVCVERLDAVRGWGMKLELSCLGVPATTAPTPAPLSVADLPNFTLLSLQRSNVTLSSLQAVVVTIGKSGPNSKCVSGSGAVFCPSDAANQGKRVNSDYSDGKDTFNVTVVNGTVCVERVDDDRGWGMKLQLSCLGVPTATPAPAQNLTMVEFFRMRGYRGDLTIDTADDSEGNGTDGDDADAANSTSGLTAVIVTIGKSGGRSKCVDGGGAFCPRDSGSKGKRVNTDYNDSDDAFEVSTDSAGSVCVDRVDAMRGWGMDLQLSCLGVAGMTTTTTTAPPVRDWTGGLVAAQASHIELFWELDANASATPPQDIPKILHQTYKSRNLPPRLAKYRDSWNQTLPLGWEQWLWTDDEIRNMIAENYPWFLPTYDGYDANVKRFDASRIFFMHRFGGIYADLDIEAIRDPTPILAGRRELVFFYNKDPVHRKSMKDDGLRIGRPHWGSMGVVTNAAFASVPGHPFWLFLAQRMMDGSKPAGEFRQLAKVRAWNNAYKDIFWATGASMLQDALALYQDVNPEARVALFQTKYWAPFKMKARDSCEQITQCQERFPEAVLIHHWTGTWNHCEKGTCDAKDMAGAAKVQVYSAPRGNWSINAPLANDTNYTNYTMQIPTILHQSYKNMSELPPRFTAYTQTWESVLPTWERRMWTDKDNRDLIEEHYPWFLPTYDAYDSDVKRFMSARFFYMHRFGGVYADMDIEAIRDPTPLFAGDYELAFFFTKPPLKNNLEKPFRWTGVGGISNALMASVPGHPFWLFVAEKMTNMTEDCKMLKQKEIARVWGYRHKDIFWGVGSSLLSEAVVEYQELHPEIKAVIQAQKYWAPYKSKSEEGKCEGPLQCGATYPEAKVVHHWTSSWDRCEPGACPKGKEPVMSAIGLRGPVLAGAWTAPPPPPPVVPPPPPRPPPLPPGFAREDWLPPPPPPPQPHLQST